MVGHKQAQLLVEDSYEEGQVGCSMTMPWCAQRTAAMCNCCTCLTSHPTAKVVIKDHGLLCIS
jgi:hypothetical protein